MLLEGCVERWGESTTTGAPEICEICAVYTIFPRPPGGQQIREQCQEYNWVSPEECKKFKNICEEFESPFGSVEGKAICRLSPGGEPVENVESVL